MLSIAYLALLQLSLAPFLSINASPVTLSSDNTTKSNSSDIIQTGQTSYPIDPDFNVAGARWLFGVCFGIMQLNAIGSIYVLYRTYIKWRDCGYKRNSLSMALRVPFYIAVSDLCLYAAHMANQGYTVINDRTWPGLSCKIVGGIVFFQVAANMTLVGIIALVTYLRVCRRIVIDFGPYDRNLFFSVLGFPLVLTLCSIPSFGPSTYWCYTNKTNHIMPIITLVLNFSIIALNVFCYFFTLRKINSSSNQLAIHVKDYVTRAANVERRVTRKIAAYILIFSIQWTPAMPYVIASVISSSTPSIALYFLADVAINLGGIGNGIQYILNEGWSTNNNDTSDFSASSAPGSAIVSARPHFTTSISPTDKPDEWELTSPNNRSVNDNTAIVVRYN